MIHHIPVFLVATALATVLFMGCGNNEEDTKEHEELFSTNAPPPSGPPGNEIPVPPIDPPGGPPGGPPDKPPGN